MTGFDLGLAVVFALLWDFAAPILALSLPLVATRVAGGKRGAGPGWYVAAGAILVLAIAVPTIGLE